MIDPKKDRVVKSGSELARQMAEDRFKQREARQTEGAKATAEYHAEGAATRKKTAKLRAQRLAKEADEIKD